MGSRHGLRLGETGLGIPTTSAREAPLAWFDPPGFQVGLLNWGPHSPQTPSGPASLRWFLAIPPTWRDSLSPGRLGCPCRGSGVRGHVVLGAEPQSPLAAPDSCRHLQVQGLPGAAVVGTQVRHLQGLLGRPGGTAGLRHRLPGTPGPASGSWRVCVRQGQGAGLRAAELRACPPRHRSSTLA